METQKKYKGYELKNIVSNIGHDLAGFRATLYKDSKKVAIVSDDGFGGGYEYHWDNDTDEKEFDKLVAIEYEEKKKLFVPKSDIEKKVGFIFDIDNFIYNLVIRTDTIKQMKKKCSKKVLYQINSEIGTNSFNVLNYTYNEEIKNFLSEKYKDCKLYILNEELIKGGN